MSPSPASASVFIAASLDGFIAREDGGIDWLMAATEGVEPEDHGFDAFFASVDAMVMGRNTWELVRTFDAWPYGGKPVFVLTNRPLEIPDERRATVSAVRGSPQEVAATLAARGHRTLYVDGGLTVQAFIAAGLVERLIVTRIPILLGRGIPLFGAVPHDVRLRHVATRSWPSGLVQSEYAPAAEGRTTGALVEPARRP